MSEKRPVLSYADPKTGLADGERGPALKSTRVFAALLLLGMGVQWWATAGDGALGERRLKIALASALLLAIIGVCIPAPRRVLFYLMGAMQRPVPYMRRAVAVILSAAALMYLFYTAVTAGRSFAPSLHDEFSYTIQTRMLATGHLWYPKHELADFFESFHLFSDPVYASKYCPGTAMLCVPAVWLGQDPWVAILVLSALCVGLLYLVLTEMIDGLAGLLGALMLPANIMFRRVSVETLSQIPMLFLLLVALWAYLHWRKNKALGWMGVMSIAVGWAAITRPVDAVALALPLSIAVLWELRGVGRGRALKSVGFGLLCVVPFLTLQAIQNKGITGSFTKLPWAFDAERDDPYDTMSSVAFNPDLKPQSKLAQKQKFFQTFTVKYFKEKAAKGFRQTLVNDRFVPVLRSDLPHALALILLPVGLLGLARRGRWILAVFLLLFLLLYSKYTFFIPIYPVTAIPAMFLIVLLGWDAMSSSLPGDLGQSARVVIAAAILVVTVFTFPQLQSDPPEEEWGELAPMLRLFDRQIGDAVGSKPAVVLFRFHPAAYEHTEPVYNWTTARPEEGRIIRAHDLGEAENQRIYAWFAQRDPSRAFYRFDRDPALWQRPISYLGTAAELAGKK